MKTPASPEKPGYGMISRSTRPLIGEKTASPGAAATSTPWCERPDLEAPDCPDLWMSLRLRWLFTILANPM
jgi:hypothetical protein